MKRFHSYFFIIHLIVWHYSVSLAVSFSTETNEKIVLLNQTFATKAYTGDKNGAERDLRILRRNWC